MSAADPEVGKATGSVRQRTANEYARMLGEDSDDEYVLEDSHLPYDGKVYLARKKKPDTWLVKILEVLFILFTICFIYYSYFHFDELQFHITHGYAHLGHAEAMHQVGQRYLYGKGVKTDKNMATTWFRHAANKGHPHASHNLAVAHMNGFETDVDGLEEAKQLLRHAKKNGVKESDSALYKLCPQGCE